MAHKKHKHDCSKCIFLGSFKPKEGNYAIRGTYDLYYHPDEEPVFRSLVARYSSKGGSYLSGMIFGVYDREDANSPLGEAWRRAKKKGFSVQEKGYEEK